MRAVTAAQLQNMDIPPIEWLVDKILPTGLSMISAPSKYYKSYMALGLCVAICTGGKFLGYNCTKHGCLYLDLESTKRRPQTRLKQIMGDQPWPDNLYILTAGDDVGKIGDGFEERLAEQLQAHPDIKFIVVDVFQLIRRPAKRTQTGYDRDYEDLRSLKKVADGKDLGLMLVHHNRKMKDPNDVFNNMNGSTGILGALDCGWSITKEDRDSVEAVLHITGRDMEPIKLKIRFGKKSFTWELIGELEAVTVQEERKKYEESRITATIKKLLQQNGGHWEGSAEDIIHASKYFNCQIHDDSRVVGKFVTGHEGDLWTDGISMVYDPNKVRGRKTYIFDGAHGDNGVHGAHGDNGGTKAP